VRKHHANNRKQPFIVGELGMYAKNIETKFRSGKYPFHGRDVVFVTENYDSQQKNAIS
jgi:hypothetical protein